MVWFYFFIFFDDITIVSKKLQDQSVDKNSTHSMVQDFLKWGTTRGVLDEKVKGEKEQTNLLQL